MYEDHEMLKRAATQCMVNMMLSDEVRIMWNDAASLFFLIIYNLIADWIKWIIFDGWESFAFGVKDDWRI